jgi:hypothetical protein
MSPRQEDAMRKVSTLLFVAVLMSFASAARAADEAPHWRLTPVQAQVYKQQREGWSPGKIAAVGVGLVAGVFAANATLPMAWGIAAPVLGGTAGAMLGNWGYLRATGEPSMLRRASAMEAEAPTLFQLAVISSAE